MGSKKKKEAVQMVKYVFYKCEDCRYATRVMSRGAAVAPESRICPKCKKIMDKSNKKEWEKLRGYDKIRLWKKDMEGK